MKICPVGAKLMRVDEQTDIMKLKDTFVTSLNVPKNKWTQPTREIVMWGQRRLEKIISWD